ncbi:MAG: YlmC/YmxH family sporulation protein [Negativibacillus sp.]
MICRIQEFRYKDVVCVEDGTRLGYVGDVELDTKTAQLKSIVIYGKYRWFFFGREEDIIVPWEEIRIIGEDTILVNVAPPHKAPRRKRRGGWLRSGTEQWEDREENPDYSDPIGEEK